MQWTASTDAQTPAAALTYNLRVGTTPGGQQVVASMSDLTTGRRRIPARGSAQQNLAWTIRNLPNGTHYWSVQAIDNGFLASGWSAEASFSVVPPPGAFSLNLPAAGAVDVPTRLQFTWTASSSASSYRLQVASDPGFVSLVVDQWGIPGTSFTPGADLSNETGYYWRILAVNPAGSIVAGNAPFSFTTRKTVAIVIEGSCGLLGGEWLLILLLLRRRSRSA